MARAGKRYPLVIYEYMLNRWWPATLTLSLVLFAIWWQVSRRETPPEEAWRNLALLAIGGITLLMTIFIFLMRKAAYVRPYGSHLRLITPFLRLNISYRRLLRTSTSSMHSLFPPSKMSSWTRGAMEPLFSKTAIVLELNGHPIPRAMLRFFLSPFFFKDKSPHLVILVKDWMSFSTELESLRTGGSIGNSKRGDKSILSGLPRA